MMIKRLFILAVAPVLMFCAKPEPPMVVPKPVSVNMSGGEFVFGPEARIVYGNDVKELDNVSARLSEYISGLFGFVPEVAVDVEYAPVALVLSVDGQLGTEEYNLTVGNDRIDIKGGSPQGVFYGVQTLRQLLTQYKDGETAVIPGMVIADKPAFGYRGTHFDVSRHFYNADEVKRYIDILAMHKINKFHWHLTEDQGWRIEIKKYPELTKVGAYRAQTLIGHGGKEPFEYDGKPYGGFYTQDEIRDVVKYAADRYITVIPEIEMPGHALAALASYNWLGCENVKYKTCERWGVFEEVFCAGKETTFEFLEGVLTEVMELFPSEYIHIGGDECPKVKWEKCPNCQARIKNEGLADEFELQSYFMKRMEKWLNERGRSIIGWDEILEGGVSKTATVMSWQGSKGGIAAAKSGNKVIMAPNSNVYLDYYQSEDTKNEPLSIGGFLPVEKVYELDPYAELNENEKQYIWGVQANLWTEYIKTMEHVEYMLLPRLAALSETAWAYDRKDYGDFAKRMDSFRVMYDLAGYNYAKHMFAPKPEQPGEGTPEQ